MPPLLAWSAGLFIAGGAVWFAIGALSVPLMNTEAGRSTLIFSNAADTKAFGATPREVLDGQPNVDLLRTVLLRILAGFLVVAGLLVAAVAYFAWRQGQAWAFWVLAATALAVVPFWLLAARPFIERGASIAFLDIPPFMWVTLALWLPAVACGALALRDAAPA